MRNTVEIGQATVFNVTIAKQNPFLYAIYGVSETGVALYIGQTRGELVPSVGSPSICPIRRGIPIFNAFQICIATKGFY